MKRFEVVIIRQDYDSYIVEAEDKGEAEGKALMGDAITMNSEPGESIVSSVEVIDED